MGGVNILSLAVICVIGLILLALFEECVVRWHRHH
jgi:hypothetical protein